MGGTRPPRSTTPSILPLALAAAAVRAVVPALRSAPKGFRTVLVHALHPYPSRSPPSSNRARPIHTPPTYPLPLAEIRATAALGVGRVCRLLSFLVGSLLLLLSIPKPAALLQEETLEVEVDRTTRAFLLAASPLLNSQGASFFRLLCLPFPAVILLEVARKRAEGRMILHAWVPASLRPIPILTRPERTILTPFHVTTTRSPVRAKPMAPGRPSIGTVHAIRTDV